MSRALFAVGAPLGISLALLTTRALSGCSDVDGDAVTQVRCPSFDVRAIRENRSREACLLGSPTMAVRPP